MAVHTKGMTGICGSMRVVLMCVALLLSSWRPAMAADHLTEYHIKAVFLYNLAHFVSWPGSWRLKSDYFTIGIYGDDPFGRIIDAVVEGEYHLRKPMRIVRYSSTGQLRDEPCDILFISSPFVLQYSDIREVLQGHPVLTVADTPGFLENGGMVNLLENRQRVEVLINRKAVEMGDLFISSKLLRLARVVE